MNQRKIFVLIAVPTLAFVAMATAIGLVIDAPHLFLLERHHAETVGQVVRLVPESHGAIEIRYSVAGITHFRRTQPYVNRLLTEGDSVPVYYYPPDPTVAAGIIGEILVLSACVLFVRLAWWLKLTWRQLLRSREFWIACGLAIAANILDLVL